MKICPTGFFCFDKNTLFLLILALIILIIYQIYIQSKYFNLEKDKVNKLKKKIIIKNEKINDLKSENLDVINDNSNLLSNIDEREYVLNKDFQRVINPLEPPERTYPNFINRVGMPINIPTRGHSSHYQQVGALSESNTNASGTDKKILPLFGRPYYPGSRQWHYYTGTDSFSSVKLPITYKDKNCQNERGCDEIYDGDTIQVAGYNTDFIVSLYELDKPRYIPYIV